MNVVVYTQNPCPYCGRVKEFLENNGVEYTVKNISENAEHKKELLDLGVMSVPVTVVEGHEPIVGYNTGKLSEVLGL